jgi:hypothetical protein
VIVNTSEAAKHLGYRTRTTLQRLLRDGHLDRYRVPGGGRQVLLETAPPGLPTLRDTVQSLTQIRHNSPLWRRGGAEEITEAELEEALEPINRWIEARDQGPDWPAVAVRLHEYLGDGWPAPPWDGDQVATLAMALSLAQEAAGGGALA